MAAPILVAALVGGLVSAAGSLVGRVLVQLGLGFVVYAGITSGLDALKSGVIANLLGMSPRIVQIVGLLKVDVAITILFSAIAARLILQGVTGGSLRKLVQK